MECTRIKMNRSNGSFVTTVTLSGRYNVVFIRVSSIFPSAKSNELLCYGNFLLREKNFWRTAIKKGSKSFVQIQPMEVLSTSYERTENKTEMYMPGLYFMDSHTECCLIR